MADAVRVSDPPRFRGGRGENGALWLWQYERNFALGAGTEALDYALVNLGDYALEWAHEQNFEGWDAFVEVLSR